MTPVSTPMHSASADPSNETIAIVVTPAERFMMALI
jgi:hypothetical protein